MGGESGAGAGIGTGEFIMIGEGMTHKELVEIGKHWVKFAKGCNPVFTELGSTHLSEKPDVIGWTPNDCIVVECKISLSDFMADFKKPHRTDGGLGNYRYYLIPFYLLEQVKDKDRKGWGLVVVNENTRAEQERLQGSKEFSRNLEAEVFYLRSRIFQIQNFGT